MGCRYVSPRDRAEGRARLASNHAGVADVRLVEVRVGRSMALALAVGVLWGSIRPLAQEQSFPHTKQRGRATVEYKDDILQVVASYDYSQRNHESPWLLVDLAAWTERRLILDRDNITLVTPSGSH